MNIKKHFLILLIFSVLVQAAIILAGTQIFNQKLTELAVEHKRTELSNLFLLHSQELTGFIIMDQKELIQDYLNDISKDHHVVASIKVDNWGYRSARADFVIPVEKKEKIELGNSVFAELTLSVDAEDYLKEFKIIRNIALTLIMSFLVFLNFLIFTYLRSCIISPIHTLLRNDSLVAPRIAPTEIQEMFSFLREWKKKREIEAQHFAFKRVTKQILHDVRSPLMALSLVLKDKSLKSTPLEELASKAIERVKAILKDLERGSEASQAQQDSLYPLPLLAVLKTVINEKTLEFSKEKIEIELEAADKFDLYASMVNPITFQRVISNLLNNCAEAMSTQRGKITLLVCRPNSSQISILIRDNGSGIPLDCQNKIWDEGFTQGKDPQGPNKGLGLSYAKEVIENNFGGQIRLLSSNKHGTTFEIQLKPCQENNPFEMKQLPAFKNYVVIDDEELTYIRLKKTSIKGHVAHLESLNGLNVNNETFYFIDPFNPKNSQSGIDFIKQQRIHSNSVLITSAWDNREIIEECTLNAVRILPKEIVDLYF